MIRFATANAQFKTLCLRAEAMYVCLRSDTGRELMLPLRRRGRAVWRLETHLPVGRYEYHFCREIDGRISYHRPTDARIPARDGQSAVLEVLPHRPADSRISPTLADLRERRLRQQVRIRPQQLEG